jgi:hypothetical protein
VLNFNCYTNKFNDSANHQMNSKGQLQVIIPFIRKRLDWLNPKSVRHDFNRKVHCWITANNLKLCYACSFYIVIRILYYYEFYISKECHMEHFVLYIEYHGNSQMCEICHMNIFYTWEESISILLWEIRERFYNRLMR